MPRLDSWFLSVMPLSRARCWTKEPFLVLYSGVTPLGSLTSRIRNHIGLVDSISSPITTGFYAWGFALELGPLRAKLHRATFSPLMAMEWGNQWAWRGGASLVPEVVLLFGVQH